MKQIKNLFLITGLLFILFPKIVYPYFITIETIKKSIGAVYFDHNRHISVKLPCKECHHELEKSDQYPTTCTACHPAEKQGKDSPRDLKKAYHDKCRGCHKKMKKTHKKAPATSECKACHKKSMDEFIEERVKRISAETDEKGKKAEDTK